MTKSEQAAGCFQSGFSCSQAVFSPFAAEWGMDQETALAIGGAFGGGIARRGETCGAVSGALMALGLKYGKRRPEDDAAKAETTALAQEFIRRFEDQFGTIQCKTLVGYDLSDPAEAAAGHQAGAFTRTCPGLVLRAAEILEELW
jgi:C_GCAxxG_C_C family probable redox protein